MRPLGAWAELMGMRATSQLRLVLAQLFGGEFAASPLWTLRDR